jgi:hypothetical protein
VIANGIADGAAVDVVREDSVRKGLLFAGTENAVWVSFDDGANWQSLQLNLPHTANRDLWLHDGPNGTNADLIVATHGRGFWILDDITPLRQLSAEIENAVTLFKPETAYRVRRDTNTDTPLPPETPAGTNPPDGAIIDYYLPHAASGAVTLEVFDAAGKLVRRYASTDKPEFDVNELEATLGVPTYWVRPPRVLSAEAGMYRWVWDIHYEPLVGGGGRGGGGANYPISAVPHDTPREPMGPRAAAGTYTVKLTAEGKTVSQQLTVKMDPRVKALPADLALENSAELKIAADMKHGAETVASIRALQTDLKAVAAQPAGPLADAITSINKKLVAVAGELPVAGGGGRGGRGGGGGGGGRGAAGAANTAPTFAQVSGELSALYGLIDSADAAPTAAQSAQLAQLDATHTKLMAEWTSIRTKDVPALNEQLKKAGLAPLEIKMAAIQPTRLASPYNAVP